MSSYETIRRYKIKNKAKVNERKTSTEEICHRFSYLRGGSAQFRKLSDSQKLSFLRGKNYKKFSFLKRFLRFKPETPNRNTSFALIINVQNKSKEISLLKLDIQFPSGNSRAIQYQPTVQEAKKGLIVIEGFQSGTAGDLYASVRAYFKDGSTLSDVLLTSVLSLNPHQLVISPRTWLVSGRAGRVEYDWDEDEFHCRAYGTITNGENNSVTYNRCRVRVTDGGVNGTLIDEFSFSSGPFTVPPGGTAYRTIDTWYPKGSSVWKKFNKRWDLTINFSYESTGSVTVSHSAVYRPMSTVPINSIQCDDFTFAQTQAERNAVEIAAEILEDRDITLYNPYWRIISSEENKAKYGIIDIGWNDDSDYWDFSEGDEMYEDISGPEQDRLDVFIPLGFAYSDDVPADKRNVGGWSTVNGPFPKDEDPDRSGSLVLLDENDIDFFGIAIAHEICHYLGENHVPDSQDDNLMHKNGGLTDHKLTWNQWNRLIQHGMMKWLAPDI